MSPKSLVDTNVLVRFFTGEPPEMANKARRLIARADAGEVTLVILPLVLAEVYFTLESFYEMERKAVAEKLTEFLQCRGIQAIEREQMLDALARCRDRGAHFVDAYLASVAAAEKQPIASFDRDFDKFKDVRRVEPTA
jgi:predicted nucleic acid-binding protein